MELKDFIDFLENNISEEAFEAMALHFARQHSIISALNLTEWLSFVKKELNGALRAI